MNVYLIKLTRVLRQVLGLLPTAIPQGVSEFNAWADSIINTYTINADSDSIKFALATMILHSGPTSAFKPKFTYFLMLRAGMAKQVAGAVFQDIKTKQQERLKVATTIAEAPAILTKAANVQPI